MTLCRHSSRVYIDEYDLEGTCNALSKRIESGDEHADLYKGALMALGILFDHEYIDTQREFLLHFDAELKRTDP